MADLYDACIFLNSDNIIRKITWQDAVLKQNYDRFWQHYVGANLTQIKDFQYNSEENTLYWHSDLFRYQKESFDRGETILFLKFGMDRELLFKCVLDTLDESIQIYDEHANIIYFNRTGKDTVGVGTSVEGKNLLEVFEVDEKDSTTLEALRMKAPVKNRFKHYYSKQGKELLTVNSAFPVVYQEQLIAVLTLEESISVISQKAEQLERLQQAMRKKVTAITKQKRTSGYTFQDLVGHHPQIRHLRELAKKVSLQENNILIIGETGTGKEILAQSIHGASNRKNGPFIALNCAAIPENLIESILFGTVKGSFTGSFDKAGLLEEANKGTLFLDELNSMSPGMQAKVLRALQEGTFRRAGGNKEYQTDIRVISSCNENPFLLMDEKKLRSDLFYRLATIILEIPPLRDRIEDMEELVMFHIDQIRDTYVYPFKTIEPEVLWRIQQYSWPGNVRELFHAVEYAMNVASDDVFRLKYLPSYCFRNSEQEGKEPTKPQIWTINSGTLQEQIEIFEADIIKKVLKHYCGNISEAARQLGLKRQSLQYRIRKYGIIN